MKNQIDGGDGAKAKITKNGAIIWPTGGTPQTIAYNDQSWYDANLDSISITVGDIIRFEVNDGGGTDVSNDWTSWTPTVAYTSTSSSSNLALAGTASMDATGYSGHGADKTIDGSEATYAQATSATPCSLTVDLGSNQTFNQVVYTSDIYNHATNYTIDVATAAAPTTWTTVSTQTSNDGNTGTATSYDIRYSTSAITSANWSSATQATEGPSPAIAGTGQNFTLTGLSSNTTYYFAIKTSDEIPIVSSLSNVPSATTTAPPSNLALGKTYSSSSNFDTSQTPDKAFDGNAGTDWQSSSGTFANQWLSVDFGTSTTFNKAVITEYGNRTTGYRIEYWNGSAWQTGYTGTTIGDYNKTVTFTAVTGSKARLYFTSGSSYQPIIYEFEIYNSVTIFNAS